MAEHDEAPEVDAEVGDAIGLDAGAAVPLALGLSRRRARDKGDPRMDAFLDEQTRLLRLQSEHLHEQRELQLTHLRVRRWKDRLSLALQALGIAAGAAIVVGLSVMVWQAQDDHGLVVEAFSVPPDLAQRGMTGQVAAAKLLDRLASLQAQSGSARAPGTYRNNWGDDIKVEIPEAGVSIGELNRYLRQWLGHETHISGEIVRTATGLSVTARTDADPGVAVEGPDGDLDKLFEQAAEAVYGRTQPYRYGALLLESGKNDEARSVFEALRDKGAEVERPWAELGLGNVSLYTGDLVNAERAHLELTRRYPAFVMGWDNLAGDACIVNHEEECLDAYRKTLALLPGGRNGQVTRGAGLNMSRAGLAAASELTGDFQVGERGENDLAELPDYDGSSVAAQLSIASDLAFSHRTMAAFETLGRVRMAPGVPPANRVGFDAEIVATRMLADIQSENWAAAVDDGSKSLELIKSAPATSNAVTVSHLATPWLAYAMARNGDLAGAQALIASMPSDDDNAVRMRGRIAAVAGDGAAAQRWFSQATRQAPSIPFAFSDWGEMLLARGDLDGAIAKFRLANQKGPHFADPLELWGEALVRKGDVEGALGGFKAANAYAPFWGRNHLRWGQALARLGRRDEARAQFRAAKGLDLSVPDRTALNFELAKAG